MTKLVAPAHELLALVARALPGTCEACIEHTHTVYGGTTLSHCTACGHQNPDEARFCARCGHALVTAPPAGHGASPGDAIGSEEAASTVDSSPTHSFRGPVRGAPYDRQLTAADAAAVAALPRGNALLLALRGPETGSRFLLDTDLVTVGRHPESDIFLDDVTVSRRHAEFHCEEASFTVEDVGSLNGTYVNRDLIDRVQLADGDEVQIGKYRLVFYTGRETD